MQVAKVLFRYAVRPASAKSLEFSKPCDFLLFYYRVEIWHVP